MTALDFKVDKEKCIKCGLCAADCNVRAIDFDGQGFPVANEDKCFECQHCFAICPVGAISIFGNNPAVAHSAKDFAKAEEIENLMKFRRSVRRFKRENIDGEKLEKLKDILNWTPTGRNNRGLHFAFVEDIEVMDSLRGQTYNCLKKKLESENPPKEILLRKEALLGGADFIFRAAPHMVVVSVDKEAPCKEIDPVIALSYFEIYAQSMGVATLWCGLGYWFLPYCDEVMARFEIPNNYEIAYVMMFGNPAVDYKRSIVPQRRAMSVVK